MEHLMEQASLKMDKRQRGLGEGSSRVCLSVQAMFLAIHLLPLVPSPELSISF